jgi:hypothetical protein
VNTNDPECRAKMPLGEAAAFDLVLQISGYSDWFGMLLTYCEVAKTLLWEVVQMTSACVSENFKQIKVPRENSPAVCIVAICIGR